MAKLATSWLFVTLVSGALPGCNGSTGATAGNSSTAGGGANANGGSAALSAGGAGGTGMVETSGGAGVGGSGNGGSASSGVGGITGMAGGGQGGRLSNTGPCRLVDTSFCPANPQQAALPPAFTQSCSEFHVGNCGPYYVWRSDSYTYLVCIFDAQGLLIYARLCSDSGQYCSGFMCEEAGQLPSLPCDIFALPSKCASLDGGATD